MNMLLVCYQSPINVTLLYFSKSDLICCKLPAISPSNLLSSPFFPPQNPMLIPISIFFLLLQPSVSIAAQHWPLSLSSAMHLLGILHWAGLNVFFAAVCPVKSKCHTWGMLRNKSLLLFFSGIAPALTMDVWLSHLQCKHSTYVFLFGKNSTPWSSTKLYKHHPGLSFLGLGGKGDMKFSYFLF